MQQTKLRPNIILTGIIITFLLMIPAWQTLAAPPRQESLAVISFPGDNEVIRGIISIRGSAVHPQFERFQVAYAVEPVTQNDQWVTIGIEQINQVVNGELAIWDTTAIPDGSYSLRLRVIRLDGNYDEIEIRQVVVANSQVTETPTPEIVLATALPTNTPTPLPPTPTIIIEVPVETATSRPLTITQILSTPRPEDASIIPIPEVNFDSAPLKSGCLWGAGIMLVIFFFFGFLSAVRIVVLGFANRTKRKNQ